MPERLAKSVIGYANSTCLAAIVPAEIYGCLFTGKCFAKINLKEKEKLREI